jgi:hypothetical protein
VTRDVRASDPPNHRPSFRILTSEFSTRIEPVRPIQDNGFTMLRSTRSRLTDRKSSRAPPMSAVCVLRSSIVGCRARRGGVTYPPGTPRSPRPRRVILMSVGNPE